MFVIYGKHVADPRWPKVVRSRAKLSSDSKRQGLVNVNIKIRKCHPKMFCFFVVVSVNIEVRTHCFLNCDAFILDWDSGFFIR